MQLIQYFQVLFFCFVMWIYIMYDHIDNISSTCHFHSITNVATLLVTRKHRTSRSMVDTSRPFSTTCIWDCPCKRSVTPLNIRQPWRNCNHSGGRLCVTVKSAMWYSSKVRTKTGLTGCTWFDGIALSRQFATPHHACFHSQNCRPIYFPNTK